MQRFLDTVEKVGNMVPHPVIIFLILIGIVIVLSAVLGLFGAAGAGDCAGDTVVDSVADGAADGVAAGAAGAGGAASLSFVTEEPSRLNPILLK